GYVGTNDQWNNFDPNWKTHVLDKFDLKYLHIKELRRNARFNGANEDSIALTKAIVATISRAQLRAFVSIVRLGDLARFNQDCGQSLNPYSLNIIMCMRLIS